MVRLSRFAFDDPRGSDKPPVEAPADLDDLSCDDPAEGLVAPPEGMLGEEDNEDEPIDTGEPAPPSESRRAA